jgi:DNA mismatch repair protein MutS
VVFLRKLVAGGASRSYGIEVARLAGLPAEVLSRARQILANLEKAELDEAGRPAISRGRRSPSPNQLALFAREAPPLAPASTLAEELAALDLDQMTPLSALVWLGAAKDKLKRG